MAKKAQTKAPAPKEAMPSKDEQIGYHKGSLMTLGKERAELVRILGIVEQLMQMHAAALQEAGVKVDATMVAQPQGQPAAQKKRPPIEDIL